MEGSRPHYRKPVLAAIGHSEYTRTVRSRTSNTECRQTGRRLALAVLAAFWLLGGFGVSAATVSEGPKRPAKASHLHCKCGKACRGASCCCVGDDPAPAQQTAARPTPPPSKTDAGPCMGAAPCGGESLPGSGTGWTVVKSAALGLATVLEAPPSGSYLSTPSTLLVPSHIFARLDDPPELAVID